MNHIHPSSNPDTSGNGNNSNSNADPGGEIRPHPGRRLLAIFMTIFAICTLIILLAVVNEFFNKVRKRRGFFLHRRMDENVANVEISNPMFGDEDMDISEVTDSTFSIEVDEKVSYITLIVIHDY